VLLTSGTTGKPKAIFHSLGNHIFNALGSNNNITLQPGDRWLIALPFYHISGISILFRVLLAGASLVIRNKEISLVDNICQYSITHVSMVHTQLYQVLKETYENFPFLKAVLFGGSSINDQLISDACQNKLPLYFSYGSTEMASQTTTTRTNELCNGILSSGHPLEYRQIKIEKDNEICVGGKTLFSKYIEMNKGTIHTIRTDWYKTGDLGYFDEAGNLHVTGRKDNMYVSGGENIHPEEIERALLSIEGLYSAIVVPVNSAEYGQIGFAFIQIEKGLRISKEKLRDELRGKILNFKIPKYFYLLNNGNELLKESRINLKLKANDLIRDEDKHPDFIN